MPPRETTSQVDLSQKKPKSRAKTVKLNAGASSSSAPAKLNAKRIDPLTAFSKHLTPTPPSTSSRSLTQPGKGKGKAKETSAITSNSNTSLWVDQYEPTNEAELAVHVKKVDNVRQWLTEAFEGGPSGALKKYRRILALTGPAGTGKTSTIRVLSQEMDFEVLEWRSSAGETAADSSFLSASPGGNELGSAMPEGLFTKFEAFLTRASTCNNLFSTESSRSKKRIILLEDLPNILHQKTQSRFHEALHSLVTSPPSDPPVPLVIIIGDAGLRGEDRDERISEGRGWGREKNQVVDVRTVVPKDLLSSVYVSEISFNPIAPTLLRKALQSMLAKHFSADPHGATLSPSKEVLDTIVESSNGDIRSAIMALQFACVVEIPSRKKKARGTVMVMEAITRREQSLALFHLLGKVLYNKRKGDPPNASASAKDLQKERELDSLLKEPTKLPPHLRHHERQASRVNVDMLYSDSPIDSSLFSLYIHQNYTQFCNDITQCADISDWLSWVDSSGGEAWYQANPHQFHLLALGTLHSLPSPVERRSQKYFKPEFFSFLQKEKDAWDGVQMTKDWIVEDAMSTEDSGWRAGGWSRNDVILELGAVLEAEETHLPPGKRPPTLHKLFSKMEFTRGGAIRAQQLDEKDGEALETPGDDVVLGLPSLSASIQQQGGWLDSDDIEDFE